MLNATAKMYNLQELIRKVHLDGFINQAVITFKNNKMQIFAIGKEIEENIVDNTIVLEVTYPCESIITEDEIALGELRSVLSKLEIYDRNDIIKLYVTNNRLYVESTTKNMIIDFDLLDKKYVKTYSDTIRVVFDNPIRIVSGDKESKLILDTVVKVDSQKLKEHMNILDNFGLKTIPIKVCDGNVITSARESTSGITINLNGVLEISGKAESVYDVDIIKILKKGIGVTTLRLSENMPMHIHVEHEGMIANYLVQVYESD